MRWQQYRPGPTLLVGAVLVLTIALGAVACDDEEDGAPAATSTEAAQPTTTPAVTSEGATPSETEDEMELSSSAFRQNETIPVRYTCDGDNVSPPLTITGVPDGTVGLALVMDDPDAPVAGGFVHWTVWNIDPATAEVPEDAVPQGGIEGQTSAGGGGYRGPCPPSGTHRYFFKLYALDTELDLDPEAAGREELEAAMEGHILARAELVGTYGRE